MTRVKTFDGLALWAMGDFVLMLWNAPARVERGRLLYARFEEVLAQNPEGVLALQVVLPSASPPDAPMRAENHARLLHWGTSLRQLVTVPLGGPMWTSLVRTIMRAMFVFTGQRMVQRVAADEQDGLDLLMPLATARTPSRKEIEAGLLELYAALGVNRSEFPQRSLSPTTTAAADR